MKCGYKSPTKLSPTKSKHECSPTKHEQHPCKEYGSPQKRDCLETNIDHVSPTKVDNLKQDRPVSNKENLLRRLEEAEVGDLDCSPLQDSGYASILHNDSQSQDEEDEFSTSCLPSYETPKQLVSKSEKPVSVCSTSMLPMLRFEEAICSTLKKSCKRSPRVDWATVEEIASSGAFGLDKVIGKKMGLERVDILGELFKRDFKHLLSKILRHLSAIDLINVISVSSTWRKILQRDSWAYSVYQKCQKEICEKEARKAEHAATRESSLFRIPLASVQKVASAACCVSKKKSNKKKPAASHSRLAEFNEIGKTLNNDQSLKVCRDCGSPAKHNPYLNRAICTRESCQLDFCTLCNCEYHFSKACITSVTLSHKYFSQPLPGSKKSKQNLRRL
ncbi:PREDICTED: F-box only protein 5 [Nanorana parkeri]|uniref:F-box only protein 5 n=1 Tax=Nanorana parkeri TaxID=125878 RepID=UPI000854F1FF|nr:PREDICTED: F-box only protein 5 [Nanorana parkeri]